MAIDADGRHQHPVTHTGTSIFNSDADWGVG
jgi:hypothetical protein